jgi:hypothetical protein
MKNILLFSIILLILFGNVSKSQNLSSTAKINSDSTITVTNVLNETHEYSIFYCKRSVPPNDDKISLFKVDGNNFIGLSLNNIIPFSALYSFSLNTQMQFGNINGMFAWYIGILPTIHFGDSFLKFFISTGPCVLIFDKNVNLAGGIGVTSTIGLDLKIYHGFGFNFGASYEGYSKTSYHTLFMGLFYRM